MNRSQRNQRIKKQREAGKRVTEIAKNFGLSRAQIYNITKEDTGEIQPQGELSPDDIWREFGTSGLGRFSGLTSTVLEDGLRELRSLNNRIATWQEMELNSSVVQAVLFAMNTMMREVEFFAEPASDSPEDQAAAEFLEQCIHDMSFSWDDTLSMILMFWSWGFSVLELNYKKRLGREPGDDENGEALPRSKYDDGRIGWRKWAPRPADTLAPGNEWRFDTHGGIQGINQQASPDWAIRSIPIEKLLLFRTTVAPKNNPEGRALALNTPIPTPNGWVDLVDIEVGDKVYGGDGKIRYVTAKSDIWQNREVYEVVFTTGSSIIADKKHLWSVTTFNDRNLNKEPRLLTTEEMYEWLNRPAKNPSFCVGSASVLDASSIALPLDPYILGYWLGDGFSDSGGIAVHPNDFDSLEEHVKKCGYGISYNEVDKAYVSGIKVLLRAIGVLDNKHIPDSYLRAGYKQRLALLQGLMDSDGISPQKNDQACKFHNSNKWLVDQFCELVRTLGGVPRKRVHTKPGQRGGIEIDGRPIVQKLPLYEVSFYLDDDAHKLPRKLANQHQYASFRTKANFIESIVPAPHCDTICIEVDDPDHLFLAGHNMVRTHNSLLRGMYIPWYYATNLGEIEAIGAERDLAGLPIIYLGTDTSLEGTNSDFALAKDIVRNIRRDEQEGIVIPYPKMSETDEGRGMLVELLSSGGQRQFDTDTIINRYEKRMAMAVLAQWVFLGMERVGTQALATVTGDFFTLALDGWAKTITDTINRHAVPRLFDLNTFNIEDTPKWRHSKVGTPDLEVMAGYINQLVGSQVITPNEDLERHLLQIARLPVPEMEPEEATEPEMEVEEEKLTSDKARDLALLLQRQVNTARSLLETEQIDQATADQMIQPILEALRQEGVIGKSIEVVKQRPNRTEGNTLADGAANRLGKDLEDEYREWLENTSKDLDGERDPNRRREIILAALLLLLDRVKSLTQQELFSLATALEVNDVELQAMQNVVDETLKIFEDKTVPDLQHILEETDQDLNAEEFVEQNQGKWTRVALVAGILWTAWQDSKFADRLDDPFVKWDGPQDSETCGPCAREMQAGTRPLSQTPTPGPSVCRGFTNCRHEIVEVEIVEIT